MESINTIKLIAQWCNEVKVNGKINFVTTYLVVTNQQSSESDDWGNTDKPVYLKITESTRPSTVFVEGVPTDNEPTIKTFKLSL